MKTIDRKLFRDLIRLRWQAVTVALVVAAGTAVFVGSMSTYRSLWLSKELYYTDSRFADVFARIKRAPLSAADALRDIKGVTTAEPRLVVTVSLLIPGLDGPATAEVVTSPRNGAESLNRVHLRSGRRFDLASTDEVVLSEAFADSHGVRPGDTLTAIVNGRQKAFHVVGVGLSPEYIFGVRPGELMPDDRRFAVLWTAYGAVAKAFDMDGSFNDVALGLARGTSKQDVIDAVDTLLSTYGSIGAYAREDQTSEKFLSQEIVQLKGMATIIPAIFLAVAAFLLNVVLGRLVSTQREQIATLKALGYPHSAIGLHYAKFAVVVVGVGTLIGTGFGAWFGHWMTALYSRFFKFPVLLYELDSALVAAALAVTLAAGVGGVLGVVRRVVRLSPASAMGPPVPPRFRAGFLRMFGIERMFGSRGLIVARDFERRPWRALLTAVGVASAVGILIAGTFSLDAMNYVIENQFKWAELEDATVVFSRPVGEHAVLELEHIPGVRAAEGERIVPARIRAGHRSREVGIMGLEPESRLRRILSRDLVGYPVPRDGVAMSAELGRRLGVAVGDRVFIDVLEGAKPLVQAPVLALVDDALGLFCYASSEDVHRWMGESGIVNAAVIAVDSAGEAATYRTLAGIPAVAGVTPKNAMLESFERTTAEYSRVYTWILAGFAAIIAVGIVYNAARIIVSERERDLATLRVIGFTRTEVSSLLLSELAAEVLLGIPIGLGFGALLARIVIQGVDAELFRVPLIIEPRTYAFAALVVAGAAVASGWRARKRLDRLDLVGVLKTRE